MTGVAVGSMPGAGSPGSQVRGPEDIRGFPETHHWHTISNLREREASGAPLAGSTFSQLSLYF